MSCLSGENGPCWDFNGSRRVHSPCVSVDGTVRPTAAVSPSIFYRDGRRVEDSGGLRRAGGWRREGTEESRGVEESLLYVRF